MNILFFTPDIHVVYANIFYMDDNKFKKNSNLKKIFKKNINIIIVNAYFFFHVPKIYQKMVI